MLTKQEYNKQTIEQEEKAYKHLLNLINISMQNRCLSTSVIIKPSETVMTRLSEYLDTLGWNVTLRDRQSGPNEYETVITLS